MDADEIRTLLGEMVFERAQKYRRRILRKRWRRTFAVAGLLVLLILLSAVGLLWKHLHREQSPAAVQGPTIFQQELQSSEWNTISYTPARRLTVQTTSAGSTAMDFRLAALDRTTAVDRSYFANVCFLGDSLTQGIPAACRRPLSAPTGAQTPASWSMAPPASAPMAAQRSPWRC